MSNVKHTPGPWHYDNEPHDPQIIALDGTHIATAHQYAETAPGVRHILKSIDAEANARLIASAPDLLDALTLAWHALKTADKIVFAAGNNGAVSVQLAQARDKARAAIAKATKGE